MTTHSDPLVRLLDSSIEPYAGDLWSTRFLSTRPTCVAVASVCFAASVSAGLLSSRNVVTGDFSFSVLPVQWLLFSPFGWVLTPASWLLSQIVAPTTGELVLLFAALALAGFEVEKLFGSLRTATILILIALTRMAIVLAIQIAVFQRSPVFMTPSVAWIGVSLCVARRILTRPRRRFVLVGSITLSEESFIDLLGLQVALMSSEPLVFWTSSAATCIVMSSLVGSLPWRLPNKLKWGVAERYLRAPHPRVRFFPVSRYARLNVAIAPSNHPSNDLSRDVAALQELGFSAEQATIALYRAGGNVHRASTLLLDGEIPLTGS